MFHRCILYSVSARRNSLPTSYIYKLEYQVVTSSAAEYNGVRMQSKGLQKSSAWYTVPYPPTSRRQ